MVVYGRTSSKSYLLGSAGVGYRVGREGGAEVVGKLSYCEIGQEGCDIIELNSLETLPPSIVTKTLLFVQAPPDLWLSILHHKLKILCSDTNYFRHLSNTVLSKITLQYDNIHFV